MAVNIKTRNLILILVITFLAGFALQVIIAPMYQHPAKWTVLTDKAPKPIGPYSQAVPSVDFVFVSGQIGLDPVTGNLSATIKEQTSQTMENLGAILHEARLNFSDVVQTRIYITDIRDFEAVNGIYQRYFQSLHPARATIQVAGLPKGGKVEIEMIAKRR